MQPLFNVILKYINQLVHKKNKNKKKKKLNIKIKKNINIYIYNELFIKRIFLILSYNHSNSYCFTLTKLSATIYLTLHELSVHNPLNCSSKRFPLVSKDKTSKIETNTSTVNNLTES